MSLEIKTTKENVVYENLFVKAYDNDVVFPSGVAGRYFRTRWTAPYGVVVIPVIDGKVVLLEHYRYAELSFSIEAPQGFGNDGSTPMLDAERELFEETGLRATSMTHLFSSGKDFENHVFSAVIAQGSTPHAVNAEDTESIRGFHTMDLTEISPRAISERGIFDPLTIAGVLAVALLR